METELESKTTLGEQLHKAAANGNVEDVVRLLGAGVDKDFENYGKCTPLLMASEGHTVGHTEVVKILLKAGADPNKQCVYGMTPLNAACCNNRSEIIAMLLRAGADPNKCNELGWSSLHSACWCATTEIVEMLLRSGADPNKTTGNKLTARDIAIHREKCEIANVLAPITTVEITTFV